MFLYLRMESWFNHLEKLSFEKETGVVLATFHDDSDDIKPNMGGTIYSETPIHGSSSEYNRLLSTRNGKSRGLFSYVSYVDTISYHNASAI